MKKLNLLAIALFAVITFLASCKKDPTTTELLVDKKWKLTAETTNNKDSYGTYKGCELDNTTTYKTGGKVSADEGASKCVATDPQTQESATWALSADEKTITVKESFLGLPISIDFTINSITETTLQTTYKFGSDTVVSTYTYVP